MGGSGLDINSLVSQLVAAERAPLQQRLTRTETQINTQLSAFGTVRSGLSAVQSALSTLKTPEALQVKRASSSDVSVFRATATGAAAPAAYSVEVIQLATNEKRSSSPFPGGATALVGAGDLIFTQNGQTFSVLVDAAMSLSGLRDAINAASGNTGVRAALLNTSSGTRLTLTSTQTGLAQAISVSAKDASVELQGFVSGMSVSTPAQDALIKIDGFEVTSGTNTVASAVTGVSLELVGAKPGTTLSLAISQDHQAVRERLSKLVTDFNAFQAQATRLRAYDAKSRTGGPLIGDAALRNIESAVRRELTAPTLSAPSNSRTLSSIGIRFGADGRLTVNESVLSEALNQRSGEVVQMLTATDGLASRLSSVIDAQISSEGMLTVRTNSLDARKRILEKDKEAIDARMLLVEKRYRTQFIGLDRMLAEMQGTSSYISKIGSGQ